MNLVCIFSDEEALSQHPNGSFGKDKDLGWCGVSMVGRSRTRTRNRCHRRVCTYNSMIEHRLYMRDDTCTRYYNKVGWKSGPAKLDHGAASGKACNFTSMGTRLHNLITESN